MTEEGRRRHFGDGATTELGNKALEGAGVGGVIGEDGNLWQYMPDRKKWVSIDEAFKGEDRETHVLPLPVAVKDIQFMESWGFLVTRSGECWHYDLESNRWQNVGPPPMRR